jgi:membrane associated rhomboid family serine protease
MDEKGILPDVWVIFFVVWLLTAFMVAYHFISYGETDMAAVAMWTAVLGLLCGLTVVVIFKIIFRKRGEEE